MSQGPVSGCLALYLHQATISIRLSSLVPHKDQILQNFCSLQFGESERVTISLTCISNLLRTDIKNQPSNFRQESIKCIVEHARHNLVKDGNLRKKGEHFRVKGKVNHMKTTK